VSRRAHCKGDSELPGNEVSEVSQERCRKDQQQSHGAGAQCNIESGKKHRIVSIKRHSTTTILVEIAGSFNFFASQP
jgi:hypothetical protein